MSNISITPRRIKVVNSPQVQLRKPDGLLHDRVYGFSVNFCDRSTWFHDAQKEVETFNPGNGATTIQLGHGTSAGNPDSVNEAIIDLSHGKVGDENDIANPDGAYRAMGNGYIVPSQSDPFAIWGPPYADAVGDLSGYVPVITVDGIEQTERSYGESSGGDYEIDYITGVVTFYNAFAGSETVEITYYWVDSTAEAKIIIEPPSGKKYVIDKVEVQTTDDSALSTDVINNVYVDSATFGLPSGTMLPSRRPTVIKNQTDVHNWAHVTHPIAPPQGSGNPRGVDQTIRIHEVKYLSEVPLLSSMGAYMKVNLRKPLPFPGTWATVVVYGITDDE